MTSCSSRTPAFGFALLCSLLLGACQSAPDTMPAPANRMHDAHAPTPFSAAEIRDACAPGREIRHAIEAGTSKYHQVTTFGAQTEETGEITVANFDLSGKAIGAPQAAKASWSELQSHASFPAKSTKIEAWSGETTLGTKSGWKYTVVTEKDGQMHVSTFVFVRDLPGPPVEYTQTVDGLPKYRMVMIGDNKS